MKSRARVVILCRIPGKDSKAMCVPPVDISIQLQPIRQKDAEWIIVVLCY